VAGRTKSEIERRGRGLLITWIMVARAINYTQNGSLDTTTPLHEFGQVQQRVRRLYMLSHCRITLCRHQVLLTPVFWSYLLCSFGSDSKQARSRSPHDLSINFTFNLDQNNQSLPTFYTMATQRIINKEKTAPEADRNDTPARSELAPAVPA
jgi:hypothetical protein